MLLAACYVCSYYYIGGRKVVQTVRGYGYGTTVLRNKEHAISLSC